jgi:hypothetical protein
MSSRRQTMLLSDDESLALSRQDVQLLQNAYDGFTAAQKAQVERLRTRGYSFWEAIRQVRSKS